MSASGMPPECRELAAGIPQLQVVGGEAAAVSPVIHLALHPQPAPEEVRCCCCCWVRVIAIRQMLGEATALLLTRSEQALSCLYPPSCPCPPLCSMMLGMQPCSWWWRTACLERG